MAIEWLLSGYWVAIESLLGGRETYDPNVKRPRCSNLRASMTTIVFARLNIRSGNARRTRPKHSDSWQRCVWKKSHLNQSTEVFVRTVLYTSTFNLATLCIRQPPTTHLHRTLRFKNVFARNAFGSAPQSMEKCRAFLLFVSKAIPLRGSHTLVHCTPKVVVVKHIQLRAVLQHF